MSTITGWSGVTESVVTIRSPFCGYNTMQCVELNGEVLLCCSNKIESVIYSKKMSMWSLTYQQSVFKRYCAQWQALLRVFAYKMAAESNWHRYGTKLRHCDLMYIYTMSFFVTAVAEYGQSFLVWVVLCGVIIFFTQPSLNECFSASVLSSCLTRPIALLISLARRFMSANITRS